MKRLSSQYARIDSDDVEWVKELKQLEIEFGCKRADAAISEFVRKVADFPNIAKLREFIPPLGGRVETDPHCRYCHGTGFEPCRHCDCRQRMLTDTGLAGEADPTCPVCDGQGSIVDEGKNNRVRVCACRRVVAA